MIAHLKMKSMILKMFESHSVCGPNSCTVSTAFNKDEIISWLLVCYKSTATLFNINTTVWVYCMRNRGLLSKTCCTLFNQLATLTFCALASSVFPETVCPATVFTENVFPKTIFPKTAFPNNCNPSQRQTSHFASWHALLTWHPSLFLIKQLQPFPMLSSPDNLPPSQLWPWILRCKALKTQSPWKTIWFSIHHIIIMWTNNIMGLFGNFADHPGRRLLNLSFSTLLPLHTWSVMQWCIHSWTQEVKIWKAR